MAAAPPIASSTKETTNYARLCRLLVDVGTQALRDTFDAIHPPANLHTVLAGNKAMLQSLRARKIINPTQWGKLFPAIPTSVSTAHFDITLLMVLLRNLCGLPSPATGWDTLPVVTDVSREADIARVKYFRNTVYGHAEHASVDDATFNTYWQDIRDTLVRLGGVQYRAAIDNLETECMDPEIENHYKELLNQWKKDEGNIRDELKEIGTEIKNVVKKLDDLAASTVTNAKETSDEDKSFKTEEVLESSTMCREKHHENEPLDYYCQECKVFICDKCGQTRHTHHTKVDIEQAAEQQKQQMEEVLQEMKEKIDEREMQTEKTTELLRKSREKIAAARNKLLTTAEELIRVLKEHEKTMEYELDVLEEREKGYHAIQLEHFQTSITQLKASVKNCEAILQRNISFEILQAQQAAIERCKGLLNSLKSTKMDIYKPSHVHYKVNEEYVQNVRSTVPGLVDVSNTNPLRSVVKWLNLKAQVGLEGYFTIVTNDSDGKQCYNAFDQITVEIQTPSGKDLKNKVEVRGDGKYSVTSTPNCHGDHQVMIAVNDQPLPGSPWSVQVCPHQYMFVYYIGSRAKGDPKFKDLCDVAVDSKTGNFAVADRKKQRIHLFNRYFECLTEFVPKGPAAKKRSDPTSVAFTNSGDVIIVASSAMLCFTEKGQFIKTITNKHVKIPVRLTVACDGRLVVSEIAAKTVKVLSPEGTELLQSLSAPDCDESPWIAVCHQDMFFVSYPAAHCVKVFNKEGEFLCDVGSEKSGDGQLSKPLGLAVDKFNNLIVCDGDNSNLKVFTLEGKFVNTIQGQSIFGLKWLECPLSIAVSATGALFIADTSKNYVQIFK
ncbi:uncharacterized protein LOC144643932 [Oculina patagonica]